MSWTDQRIELLKKLWSDGLSASQIVAELGGDVSRNGVIGKAHRLGLTGRSRSASSRPPRPRRPSAVQKMRVARLAIRANTKLAHAHRADAEPEPETVDNIIPINQRRTLLELSEHVCHWPVGEPCKEDFFYCGGDAIQGLSYCAYHARIAYQPAADRRRSHRLANAA